MAERGAGKPPVKARSKGARPAPEVIQPEDYAAAQSVSVLDTAQRIAAIAQDKLAEDVLILDMREFCSFTDYFVVCSGNTGRQAKAIHDGILVGLKQEHDRLPPLELPFRLGIMLVGAHDEPIRKIFEELEPLANAV